MYEENAHRGALLLDSAVPDWRHQIDLNRLELSSCARCVLGQVFGDYQKAIDTVPVFAAFDRHDRTAAFYGFELPPDARKHFIDERTWRWHWNALRTAWVEVITGGAA